MQECPPDVVKRAEALYNNSFSGFQPPHGGGKDCFVICYFDSKDLIKDMPEIRKESGCVSLVDDDWIGHAYLMLHWSEYAKITEVFNTLLKRGHSFSPRTKAQVSFSATKDSCFTMAAHEEKAIHKVRELIKMGLTDIVDDSFCEEWNYLTEEGKAFARSLRENPAMWRYDTDRTNFYHWEIFKHDDTETLLSTVVIEEVTPIVIEENNDTLCMICLDNEADTMVLPCEHCVVCKACSLGLEKTPVHNTCVRCRRPITHKLC